MVSCTNPSVCPVKECACKKLRVVVPRSVRPRFLPATWWSAIESLVADTLYGAFKNTSKSEEVMRDIAAAQYVIASSLIGKCYRMNGSLVVKVLNVHPSDGTWLNCEVVGNGEILFDPYSLAEIVYLPPCDSAEYERLKLSVVVPEAKESTKKK